MKYYILCESDIPTNTIPTTHIYEDNKTNSILQSLKDTITMKVNNWTSYISDWSEEKFGIPVNAHIERNDKLSSIVTNLFENTIVNVYIYSSKKPNIIGIPGANKNITPEMLRNEAAKDAEVNQYNTQAAILNTLNRGYYAPFRSTISSSIFETTANAIQNNNKDGGESKLIYNESTNKLSINIPEVTVYISSNYINCMDNDDEIVASILHEISKNTILFKKLIQDKVYSVSLGGLLVVWTSFSFGSMLYADNHHFTENQNSRLACLLFGSLGILLIAYMAIALYLGKRRNITYDEFVVKCGYGDALNRAIDNYNKYVFGNSTTQSDALKTLGVFDKIGHWFSKVGAYISNFFRKIGLSKEQSIQRRHDTILDKTNRYNYTLSDRSNSI